MLEDADHPARCRQSFVEEIRGNSLNRIPQLQKLRFSFGRHRPSNAGKLVHRRVADLAVDDGDHRLVDHREFESHPAGVVTYHPAPPERHRKPPTSGLAKNCPFAGPSRQDRSNPAGQTRSASALLSTRPLFGTLPLGRSYQG